MTRFIILVLTLFLTTSEAYAEWVKTAESDDATGYGDPDTIRSKGNLVKMWILYDYKTIQTVAGDSYLSQKMQWEYDCAEEQSRLIAGYSYSGQMGTGKIMFSKTNPGNWAPAMPGSTGHANWVFACKKLGTNGPIF